MPSLKALRNNMFKINIFEKKISYIHRLLPGVQPCHRPDHHRPHLLVAAHAKVSWNFIGGLVMMHFEMLSHQFAEYSRACTRPWACRPRWPVRRRIWTTCPSGSSTASSWWTSSSSSTPPRTSSSTSLLGTHSETKYCSQDLHHDCHTFSVQKDFHFLEQRKQRGLLSCLHAWQKHLQQVPQHQWHLQHFGGNGMVHFILYNHHTLL